MCCDSFVGMGTDRVAKALRERRATKNGPHLCGPFGKNFKNVEAVLVLLLQLHLQLHLQLGWT